MTPQEKIEFFADVDRWTADTLPRLEAVVDAWTETDIKDFRMGLRLCSALSSARQFVSRAFDFSVAKRIQIVHFYMDKIKQYDVSPKDVINHGSGIIQKSYPHVGAAPKHEEDPDTGVVYPVKSPADIQSAVDAERAEFEKANPGNRPQHFDSYIHLLSPELREEAKNLRAYWTELVAARQLLDKLVESEANKADISAASKAVVKWDNTIKSIYARANEEWAAIASGQNYVAASPAVPSESGVPTPAASSPSPAQDGGVPTPSTSVPSDGGVPTPSTSVPSDGGAEAPSPSTTTRRRSSRKSKKS